MVNINISIKEEAYNYLKSLKGNDKSFSDVILDLKNEKRVCSGKDLIKLAEKFRSLNLNIDWDEKEKRMNEFRNGFEKNLKERLNDRNRH